MESLYQLKNVSFYYDNEFFLTDINLEVEKSIITALTGPNGSGKTTLLDILSFLKFPNSGEFLFDGIELTKKNIESLRKNIGYIQQNPYLFRGTVYDNIEIVLKLRHVNRRERIRKINEIFSLMGIEHLSNRLASSLSGGEVRKVAITQTMVLEPNVLIMDEPFANLDQNSVFDLEELILFLKNKLNKSIIFTTHEQIQAQKLTDHTYGLIKGRLFPIQHVNLFSGTFNNTDNSFNTGRQVIIVSDGTHQADYIAIDPKQIVLSLEKLDSSMQNSFFGKITGMSEENDNIKLNIDIGEKIQVIITHRAFSTMQLSLGMDIWVSFKGSSVVTF